MDLAGARVLVTGGSSGIGLALARLLVERGSHVAICGRDAGKLEAATNDLDVTRIQADVSRAADVRSLIDATIRQLGGYDVLINNAGFGHFSDLVDLSEEDFDRVFATNVRGAMLVGRESARHFIQQKRGNIVNVGSTASRRGFAGGTAYVASKFALRGMTECWRAELRQHNIRVMLIDPSEVQTNFFSASGRERPQSERKLRGIDIAQTIVSMLELDDRGFVPEVTVWATNPD